MGAAGRGVPLFITDGGSGPDPIPALVPAHQECQPGQICPGRCVGPQRDKVPGSGGGDHILFGGGRLVREGYYRVCQVHPKRLCHDRRCGVADSPYPESVCCRVMFIRSGPGAELSACGRMDGISLGPSDIAIVFSCHWASWSHIPLFLFLGSHLIGLE